MSENVGRKDEIQIMPQMERKSGVKLQFERVSQAFTHGLQANGAGGRCPAAFLSPPAGQLRLGGDGADTCRAEASSGVTGGSHPSRSQASADNGLPHSLPQPAASTGVAASPRLVGLLGGGVVPWNRGHLGQKVESLMQE